jgi:hypothetical protein
VGEVLFRITVLWDPNRYNPNRLGRMHAAAKTRLKNAARDRAALCYGACGRPKAGGPVDVEIVLRRGRALDDDNAVAALKPVRDVLFNDAITPDDSERWVRYLPVRQEIAAAWKGREEVVFVVRAREVERG